MSRFVAIVGKFTHEGITTALKARDLVATHTNLYRVSAKTWSNRIDNLKRLRENGQLAGTIIHLPTPMVIAGSHKRYREQWIRLLDEAAQERCVAFVFSDNLARRFRPINPDTGNPFTDAELEEKIEETEEYTPLWSWQYNAVKEAESRIDDINSFFDAMYERNIEISPFNRRDEVTIKIQDFLDEVDKNIFLRMYVPNQRFQSDQMEGLLRIFERYLRQVESRRFNIESRVTGTGTLYVFCSSEGEEPFRDLEEAFRRFDDFMKLCRDDPEQAGAILIRTGMSGPEVQFLTTKYARDYQRILIDAKHELQQKMLLLSQKFDLESLNFSEEKSISSVSNADPSSMLSFSGNTGPISINFGNLSSGNINKGKR
ncbi:MAG: hypothetical protein GY873_09470 [Bosea sp.]|uniref:hypothetical protein n=1 Tax=Bosea sp. (in: a-proteobacteria) TaxID=1871050 RepID=UPI0023911B31|nr:hypothetical protein [Bosea sp. (in: a-proteobacteria)]MCP4734407.1 hypothetical protein [Bosea sp. (in: a-proteobacteria)]